jgi:hypothetical protein
MLQEPAWCYDFENMLLSAATPQVLSLPPASEPGGCVKFVSAILEMRNLTQPLSNPEYDLPCLDQPTPKPKTSLLLDGFEANRP